MPDQDPLPVAERVSAMIEEQSLTKEDLMTYLRQIMEIREIGRAHV
jgi:hypothetical protein